MYNISLKRKYHYTHNKKYALKLVQEKSNGLNNYSYSQIANLTEYTKAHIYRISVNLNKKGIDSMLVHSLTNKPSITLSKRN